MRPGLAFRMLLGLLVGASLGTAAHLAFDGSPILEGVVRNLTEPAGKIFIRLLFMLVIPLLVCALALGIAGLGDLRKLGRIGLRTFVYTVLVSAVAVLIGIGLVNLLRPGDSVHPDVRARLMAAGTSGEAKSVTIGKTGVDFIVGLVPSNPVQSMAEGDMLPVMVFALFLGVGLALTRTEPARRFEEALEGLFDVSMRLLEIVLRIAPVGVACLLFTLTARLGLGLLRELAVYVIVVVLALAIHQFVVYSLLVRWLGGMSPLAFFAAVRPAMITAFSTASSNAALPTSLLVAEERLHLPRDVSRFVLTLGSTANQNGSALFEGVTVLFLAQLYGVPLGFSEQVSVVLVCILGGIGTAGVPAGSLPVVALILAMVGVPPESLGIVLGVDRLLDMCRTTLNVTGDLVAATVIARGEQRAAAGGAP